MLIIKTRLSIIKFPGIKLSLIYNSNRLLFSNSGIIDLESSFILNITLKRPICKETTALGATYICGLKVGLFASKEEVSSLHLIDSMFTSSMNDVTRNKLVSGWKKAVKATLEYK